jgi:hypothetical protein
MNASPTTKEMMLFLFPPPVHGEDLDCPRCGVHRLVEDADPALFSCFGCWTWLRRGADGERGTTVSGYWSETRTGRNLRRAGDRQARRHGRAAAPLAARSDGMSDMMTFVDKPRGVGISIYRVLAIIQGRNAIFRVRSI